MKKVLVILFLGFSFLKISAQVIMPDRNNGLFKTDSTSVEGGSDIKLSGKTKPTDFRLFSIANDTTIVDTTLTLQKDFKFNYIRKDNFELLPFHNQGQTFNKLDADFTENSVFPTMGMGAKQFNYYTVEAIKYYKVPTPTSEFMYRTGLEQGQVLDAFLTMNTSPRFNFSLAYKGLRSLGKYRQSLASHGNFRTTFNYHSKNKNYYLKGHFYSFDLLNEENGGLTQESIDYFETNDPNYIDRGRLEVNFTDAESMYEGKRYYVNQTVTLFSKKNQLTKKHIKSELIIAQRKADSIQKINALKVADSIRMDSINLITKTELIASDLKPADSISIKNNDSIPALINKAEITIDKKTLNKSKDSTQLKISELDTIQKDVPKSLPKKDLITSDLKPKDSLSISIKRSDTISELKSEKELILDQKSIKKPTIKSKDSTKIKISKLDTIQKDIPKSLPKKELITSDLKPKDSLPISIKKSDTISEINEKKALVLDQKSTKKPNIKTKDSTKAKISKLDTIQKDIPKSLPKKELITSDLKPKDSLSISIKKSDTISEINEKKALVLDQKSIKKPNIKIKDSTKAKISKLDSIKNIKDNLILKLGHTFTYETKHYRFKKDAAGSYFGESYETSISDHTSYQNTENQLYLELYTPYTGTLRAKANHYKYNYHYNSILYLDTITISDKLKGNVFSAGADWKANIGNLTVTADATSIISGDLTGHSIKAAVNYKKDSIFSIKGYAEVTSKSPSLNKLLYQSAFKDYNWKNNFDNEEIKSAGAEFKLNKWGSINASYNLIDNYTYFDTISSPTQAKETLNYIKVKANQYFTFRNFTLDNTVMYQTVLEGESFFHVPQIVTRNTLYYANYVFKGKPLYLQTGVTFKYFTAFKANAYNPLLSEFVLQDDTEIGNYPILDFFFNMQVRRTRIFLKVENFGASFTGRNYYSAPNYPYRDLTVRFGLVWNFFI